MCSANQKSLSDCVQWWWRKIILKNIRRISIFCIFKIIFGDFVFSIDCVTAIAFEGISKAYILDKCSLCHTGQLLYRHAVLILSFWGSTHSKPYKNSENDEIRTEFGDPKCQKNQHFVGFFLNTSTLAKK